MSVRSSWSSKARVTNDRAVPPMNRKRYVLPGSTSIDAYSHCGDGVLPGILPLPFTSTFAVSPLQTNGFPIRPLSISASVFSKMSDMAIVLSSSYLYGTGPASSTISGPAAVTASQAIVREDASDTGKGRKGC